MILNNSHRRPSPERGATDARAVNSGARKSQAERRSALRGLAGNVLAVLSAGALLSCTIQHDVVDIPLKYHRDSLIGTVGGQGANQYGADGSQVSTYDTTQSFGNAMTAATTLGLGAILGSVSKAQEVTKQVASKGATQQALGAQTAGVAKVGIAAKQATTTTAIQSGATVNPVTVNAP